MADDLVGWGETNAPEDGDHERDEIDIKKLRAQRNRYENKKGGGFQVSDNTKMFIEIKNH